jgi:membrane protein
VKPLRSLKVLGQLVRRAVREWREDDGSLVAAGLSFFTIFSLVPAVWITISILGRAYARLDAKAVVMGHIAALSSPETARTIDTLLQSANQKAGAAGLLGSLLLLWAGSRIFSQLQAAFNIIWESSPRTAHGIRRILTSALTRFRALAMTVVLGIALIVFSFMDFAVAALQNYLTYFFPTGLIHYVWPLTSLVVSIALFTCVFALIYKWLPETRIGWRDAWVGAVFSAVVFTFGRYCISLYFRFSNVSSAFGAAGSVIAVLVWIYFAMEIFLLGAEFTWVYAHRGQWLNKNQTETANQ